MSRILFLENLFRINWIMARDLLEKPLGPHSTNQYLQHCVSSGPCSSFQVQRNGRRRRRNRRSGRLSAVELFVDRAERAGGHGVAADRRQLGIPRAAGHPPFGHAVPRKTAPDHRFSRPRLDADCDRWVWGAQRQADHPVYWRMPTVPDQKSGRKFIRTVRENIMLLTE